jgi:C1A family cysteine protease
MVGKPVPFGTEVGDEVFGYDASKDPIGTADDVNGATSGGHMMCIVGYEGDVAIVLNSWDTSWGDHGFGRFHRSKIEHGSSTDFYSFTITEVAASDDEEAA